MGDGGEATVMADTGGNYHLLTPEEEDASTMEPAHGRTRRPPWRSDSISSKVSGSQR